MTEALVAMQVEREPLEETANGEDPVTSTAIPGEPGGTGAGFGKSIMCTASHTPQGMKWLNSAMYVSDT